MRTYLLALVALVGCKKASESTPPPGPPRSTADVDALWAVGPEKFKVGFVVSPRALGLMEVGALRLQTLVNTAPDLAFVKARLEQEVTAALGGPFKGLADLGLDKTRGIAWFVDANDEPIIALPIADRAKLAKLTGQDLGTDPNKLGPMVCKTINTISVCAEKEAALANLGKAKVPAAIAALGVRGDIEGAGGDGTISGAGVMQLERGEGVAHVAVSGVPMQVAMQMGAAKFKPRVETDRSVAFAVAPITLLSQALPANLPLPGGGTLGDLLGTVNGPVTITIAAGSVTPDVRIPVSDPAPAQRLIDNCKDFIPPQMLAATQEPGTCRFNVPQYAVELDLWVDDKEIRVGAKKPAAASGKVALTPLGKEIASGDWALAFWGRGSMLGATGLPAMAGMTLPDEGAAMVRLMTLLSEMGIAVRAEGDKVSGVFGFRTIYANPDDVITKVLAVPPADVIAGKSDVAKGIASAAPSSPFAGDLSAGQGGLMVPTAVIGMLAAVAIPAFMDYMKKSKKSEVAITLNRIAKNLRFYGVDNSKLPVGQVAPGPTCCGQPDNKCAPTAATWNDPIWKAIEFSIEEPSLYRYGYTSDGLTVTVTAVGDLDCDGTEVTYTLTGTLDPAIGELKATIMEPPPNSD